jgi:DNA-binding PadR family transcriptional regulator
MPDLQATFNRFTGPAVTAAVLGPFSGRASKGDIRNAILGLLAEESSNGYAFIRNLKERSHGNWRVSPGSVYPTLQALVNEGLVNVNNSGVYTLTSDGETYVREHDAEIKRTLSFPVPEKDELRTAVSKLLGAIQQAGGNASAEQRTEIREKVEALRKDIYRMLSE